jgi:hypothetical protein
MRRLGLRVDEIQRLIAAHDVIEHYEDRLGVLLYGRIGGMEVHISVVHSTDPALTLVTTVYAVDRTVFPDGRTRRSSR